MSIAGPIALSLSIIWNLSAHFVLHRKHMGCIPGKYFYERFWMMGENNVPITLRKMSQFNTWKDLKMLKCLQNLQSFIFFIFGVEKLSENSITCLMKKQFDQCVGQILLKKGS